MKIKSLGGFIMNNSGEIIKLINIETDFEEYVKDFFDNILNIQSDGGRK